jgi:hypothetical protein
VEELLFKIAEVRKGGGETTEYNIVFDYLISNTEISFY